MTFAGSPGDDRKYELVPDLQIRVWDWTLYRIRALKDFGHVKAGTLGGFVASTRNLSQDGDCWVADDACVYNEAFISCDAQIRGLACVYGRARIFDKGQVLGCAHICGDAWVFKSGMVFDNALVFEDAQVRDHGRVFGRARLGGFVRVIGSGEVSGDTRLCGRTVVGDDEAFRSSGRGAPPRGGRWSRPPRPRPPRP
jgi:hypothetical protein